MSTLSTHVLDTSVGRPAAGMRVDLVRLKENGNEEPIGAGETDSDGRLASMAPASGLTSSVYRLRFVTGEYFEAQSKECFYPCVVVNFKVTEGTSHLHVPLLISPFGYSTYRGS